MLLIRHYVLALTALAIHSTRNTRFTRHGRTAILSFTQPQTIPSYNLFLITRTFGCLAALKTENTAPDEKRPLPAVVASSFLYLIPDRSDSIVADQSVHTLEIQRPLSTNSFDNHPRRASTSFCEHSIIVQALFSQSGFGRTYLSNNLLPSIDVMLAPRC